MGELFCGSSNGNTVGRWLLPPQKAPLCKGGCQPNRLTGGLSCSTPYNSSVTACAVPPPQAPFVCFADIFPANGEIYPLHKGGFRTSNARPYEGSAPMVISQGKICRKNLEKRSIFMKIPLYFWKNLW